MYMYTFSLPLPLSLSGVCIHSRALCPSLSHTHLDILTLEGVRAQLLALKRVLKRQGEESLHHSVARQHLA
jgi:hypothetical protein